MRISDKADRQNLLDLAVDMGILHFDTARLYGLGQVEAEMASFLRRHSGQLTVTTKCGLGDSRPPSAVANRQGYCRRLLNLFPGLRPFVRRVFSSSMVRRDFSAAHCQRSLETSLSQLGLEAVDLLLLHEPGGADFVDPTMEDCLLELHRQGLIGGYGISGHLDPTMSLGRQRPGLAIHVLQWEDDLLEHRPLSKFSSMRIPQLRARFGRIRRSLLPITQAFSAVPQLQRYWSDRLNIDLSEPNSLVGALLGAALVEYPSDLLLFATTDPHRLRRIIPLLHDPPWGAKEAIAFAQFWRPPLDSASSPCL